MKAMMVDNEEDDISGENEAISFDEEKWHFESREADPEEVRHCMLPYIRDQILELA